jgi:predicted nuclease of predicted toxin-antitoxin system
MRFAVLIDSDNVSEKYLSIILDETANYGVATYKRIYGDWTSSRMTSWKGVLLDNSITPIQQYSYTTGKNATDSAMIIDAMDILYSNTVDGFVLVSSDSDFTRLAARLREAGKTVIGMGETKTPQPFISACNQFKYLDMLYEKKQNESEDSDEAADSTSDTSVSSSGKEQKSTKDGKSSRSAAKNQQKNGKKKQKLTAAERREIEKKRQKDLNRVRKTLNQIIEKYSDEDNWIRSSRLAEELQKRIPEFDVRNFGFNKFSSFIKSLGTYEWEEQTASNGRKEIRFRLKDYMTPFV